MSDIELTNQRSTQCPRPVCGILRDLQIDRTEVHWDIDCCIMQLFVK